MYKYKKTRLYGYMHDFSVDYASIDVDYVLDIQKYLMRKSDTNWCVDLLGKSLLDDNDLADH